MTVSKKVRKHLKSIAGLGGQAASKVMTDAEKIDRARAGGEAVAANMTAAQRTARARKAAQTRHGKLQPEATM